MLVHEIGSYDEPVSRWQSAQLVQCGRPNIMEDRKRYGANVALPAFRQLHVDPKHFGKLAR
jgi:hypothetical protein